MELQLGAFLQPMVAKCLSSPGPQILTVCSKASRNVYVHVPFKYNSLQEEKGKKGGCYRGGQVVAQCKISSGNLSQPSKKSCVCFLAVFLSA